MYSIFNLVFYPVSSTVIYLFLFLMSRPPSTSTLFPYTTLFRSLRAIALRARAHLLRAARSPRAADPGAAARGEDRKSTRLNSSHLGISYAVFCLKKKKKIQYFR